MKNPIDHYLSKLPIKDRDSLISLQGTLRELLPGCEECISYGMPTFKIEGKAVAGFAVFKNHLSFFPFSGSILEYFSEELKEWKHTKSGIHFTPENPIPRELIRKIIKKRITL